MRYVILVNPRMAEKKDTFGELPIFKKKAGPNAEDVFDRHC